MALPIQVNPKDPCIDIHTGRGQGSCTFANGFNCVCSCAGIAHAQLLRMVLTPENSKKLPDKYKQALANKVQTVQARIADIPHDKVTTIIHAQKQPKRVFFLCEDVSHPIIDYCRVIDILRWARENPLASQQVSKLCTCVQNHGINSFNDFLYEAIYIPDGVEPPPKSIINCPELQEYVFEFGKRKDDRALVAEVQGNVIGAIWVRIMNDYGHIDNDTPSLAMSVFQKYRGQGIGTSLLQQLLLVEKSFGYSKISLSVQKNNYAVKMYKKAGFLVVDENSEEYIMTINL